MKGREETLNIRKATIQDISGVEAIYNESHDAEDAGKITTGWIRGVYPVRSVAEAALGRGDLFVMEENSRLLGAALINQIQVDVYQDAPWEFSVPPEEVCVLHTLVISPKVNGNGFGKQFVRFYEEYARAHHLTELRMDTNARNERARTMYRKLGYKEIAIVPTVFNGIPNVQLVLLEKHL